MIGPNELPRVPMPRSPGAFIADGDVAVGGIDLPRVGRRVHMDIDEFVFAKMGKAAIESAVVRLGEAVVYRNEPAIRRAVESFILDRKWAEPIIREEISKAVRSIIADMLSFADDLPPDSAVPQAPAPSAGTGRGEDE